jgi:hypothetical protein
MDKDLYDLPPKELKKIPTVCGSLRDALGNLDKDRDFLKAGGVFDDDFIDSTIELKMTEVIRFGIAAQFCDDKRHSVRHQTGDEMHVPGQAIELGDDHRTLALRRAADAHREAVALYKETGSATETARRPYQHERLPDTVRDRSIPIGPSGKPKKSLPFD